jgi:hypothetical protein
MVVPQQEIEMNRTTYARILPLVMCIGTAIACMMLCIFTVEWQIAEDPDRMKAVAAGFVGGIVVLFFCFVVGFIVAKGRFSWKESAIAFAGAIFLVSCLVFASNGSIDALQWAGTIVPLLAVVIGLIAQPRDQIEVQNI